MICVSEPFVARGNLRASSPQRRATACCCRRTSGASPGAALATSQSSVTVRPVLNPPWTTKLPCGRAVTLTSTPFQCSVCFAEIVRSVTKLSWGRNQLVGWRSNAVCVYPPPPGRRESVGALNVNFVVVGRTHRPIVHRLEVAVPAPEVADVERHPRHQLVLHAERRTPSCIAACPTPSSGPGRSSCRG